jgi:hypothetical protein
MNKDITIIITINSIKNFIMKKEQVIKTSIVIYSILSNLFN